MKGFDKAGRVLEFDRITERLASLAATEGAAEALRSLQPADDGASVNRLLDQTADARAMMTVKSQPPFGRAKNITPHIERAVKGATLTTRELLDVASLLRTVGALKKYGAGGGAGSLHDFFRLLTENNFLEKSISGAIAAEDMLSDNASDELFSIRRSIRKCESAVRDGLARYTTGSYAKYLQEGLVTVRNGRFVIPVKAEHKGEIKGIVHDTSSSGGTLFVEPLDILELNNRISELHGREKHEIDRILAELSASVASFADDLRLNYRVLTDLAVIFAKAQYSFEINGIRPAVRPDGRVIRLKNARHPLIDKETVVPITVEFGGETDALVITGPNTGGKTVTLKTIGLMALMAQSGLFVPCDDGSTLPVFSAVLPDIGDEQSIEQSLSTFSSHMVNIVSILDVCDRDTLVLFDELGAGTDPIEGAALAVAILEHVAVAGRAGRGDHALRRVEDLRDGKRARAQRLLRIRRGHSQAHLPPHHRPAGQIQRVRDLAAAGHSRVDHRGSQTLYVRRARAVRGYAFQTGKRGKHAGKGKARRRKAARRGRAAAERNAAAA